MGLIDRMVVQLNHYHPMDILQCVVGRHFLSGIELYTLKALKYDQKEHHDNFGGIGLYEVTLFVKLYLVNISWSGL